MAEPEQEERVVDCEACGDPFNESELEGGLCVDCREDLISDEPEEEEDDEEKEDGA